MNELVQPERGILVECLGESKPMGLSQRHYFDPQSLAQEVERALRFDEPTRARMCQAARHYFVENDREFRRRFIDVMREVERSARA